MLALKGNNIEFYFQSRKIEVHRELFEFSTARGARKGRELVPPGHRLFARIAGRWKKKIIKRRETPRNFTPSRSIWILRACILISDIATRA